MILFYNKNTGEIFSVIDGRVHDKKQMSISVNNGLQEEEIGKFIIGWEETDEVEEVEKEFEVLVDMGNGFFKKENRKEKVFVNKKIEHNLDKFDILQRFEDTTPENPFDYKIENNNLIKK